MATGLVALLDDIAAIAKVAAASADDIVAGASKASAKTVGVIIDDAAVTPQYVDGLKPNRELPIIWRIAKGSLRNKIVFILPAIILLSMFLPQALPVLLILGGTYLTFEGAEKILSKVLGKEKETAPSVEQGTNTEDQVVSNATRTDFILSAEIMVISLNEVTDWPVWQQAVILVIVAIFITALVYGAVAIIVKADDFGLKLIQDGSPRKVKWGNRIINAMPKVMTALTVVGTFAMLWVGGHLILQSAFDLGFTWPMDTLHNLTAPIYELSGIGGFLGWLVDTLISTVFGLIWGVIVATIVNFLPFGHKVGDSPIDVEAHEDSAGNETTTS